MKKLLLIVVLLSGCHIDGKSAEICVHHCQDKGGMKFIELNFSDNTDRCVCQDGSLISLGSMKKKYKDK